MRAAIEMPKELERVLNLYVVYYVSYFTFSKHSDTSTEPSGVNRGKRARSS